MNHDISILVSFGQKLGGGGGGGGGGCWSETWDSFKVDHLLLNYSLVV